MPSSEQALPQVAASSHGARPTLHSSSGSATDRIRRAVASSVTVLLTDLHPPALVHRHVVRAGCCSGMVLPICWADASDASARTRSLEAMMDAKERTNEC